MVTGEKGGGRGCLPSGACWSEDCILASAVMCNSGFDIVSADFECARQGSLPFTVRASFQLR